MSEPETPVATVPSLPCLAPRILADGVQNHEAVPHARPRLQAMQLQRETPGELRRCTQREGLPQPSGAIVARKAACREGSRAPTAHEPA